MSNADTSSLTIESQKYLEGQPSGIDWSLVTIEVLRSFPLPPFPSDISWPKAIMESIQIHDLQDNHPINIEVFRPSSAAPEGSLLPGLIYLNGGGFTLPPSDGHRYMAAKLATEVSCAVFLVTHSLSPEARFPVALEEYYSVVSYLTNPENAHKLNIDPSRIAVGGDSSGGNLTAAVTILAKQRNELKNKIKYQVLVYPTLDDSLSTESFLQYGEGFGLTKGVIQMVHRFYTTDSAKGNVLFTPILATTEELTGLPPAFVMSAEADVLRSETEDYGRKLLKAGVPVTSIRVNGVLHGFLSNSALFSNDTLIAIDTIGGALRRAFAESQ